jgi:hypothetical protein
VRTHEAGESYLEGMIVEVKEALRPLPTVPAMADDALLTS